MSTSPAAPSGATAPAVAAPSFFPSPASLTPAADGAPNGEGGILNAESSSEGNGNEGTQSSGAEEGAEEGAEGDALPNARRGTLLPNSFQRYVQQATGVALPVFGAEYFSLAPSTFAPLRNAPVPADYVLGPGDEIFMRVTGVIEMARSLVVDQNGRIVIPKVGAVTIAGVKAVDLERFLTRELERSFRNFTLTATLGSLRSIEIYVVGQAQRPGKHTVSSLSSLVNALFVTGGPGPEGSMRHVQLVRDGSVFAEVDMYEFMSTGMKKGDVNLRSGDTIVIPRAGARVALLGDARRPAVYELLGATASVGDVLALQGGLPVTATPLKAHLERIDATQRVARSVEEFALDAQGLQRTLRDGDVLFLYSASPEFGNVVTLRGNVASPGRYPFAAGMRIKDLIPNRESLITVDYHRRKNAIVFQGEPGVTTAQREVNNLVDEVNWEYAIIERLDKKQLTTQLIPFHLGKAVLEGDPQANVRLEAGDVVTIFGENDIRGPQSRRTRLVRIEGEVGAPGVYTLGPKETLRTLLERVGGLTPDAYVFGTTLRRVSVREVQATSLKQAIRELEDRLEVEVAQQRASRMDRDVLALEEGVVRQSLARLKSLRPDGRLALELDPERPELPDLVLEAEDHIVVPARPSAVMVIGAVAVDSGLLWQRARSVEDYLKVAGPTELADPNRAFVVRADGTVKARGTSFIDWFGNPVLGMRLEPGDVVVVPQQRTVFETPYMAFMREVKDWTQILANVALPAAIILNLTR